MVLPDRQTAPTDRRRWGGGSSPAHGAPSTSGPASPAAAVGVETVHEHADAGAAVAYGQARCAEGRPSPVDQAGAVQPEFAGHLGAGQLDQCVRAVPVEFATPDA